MALSKKVKQSLLAAALVSETAGIATLAWTIGHDRGLVPYLIQAWNTPQATMYAKTEPPSCTPHQTPQNTLFYLPGSYRRSSCETIERHLQLSANLMTLGTLPVLQYIDKKAGELKRK